MSLLGSQVQGSDSLHRFSICRGPILQQAAGHFHLVLLGSNVQGGVPILQGERLIAVLSPAKLTRRDRRYHPASAGQLCPSQLPPELRYAPCTILLTAISSDTGAKSHSSGQVSTGVSKTTCFRFDWWGLSWTFLHMNFCSSPQPLGAAESWGRHTSWNVPA